MQYICLLAYWQPVCTLCTSLYMQQTSLCRLCQACPVQFCMLLCVVICSHLVSLPCMSRQWRTHFASSSLSNTGAVQEVVSAIQGSSRVSQVREL